MEIYKLSDEISEENSTRLVKNHKYGVVQPEASGGVGVSGGAVLKITDIKQAVKNENRVNVFVNGKYSFSLDVAQVVDMGVKVGRIVSEDELADFKKASEFGKAYQRALEWVLMRPRSKRELQDYLKRREMQGEAKERKKDWERDREIADLIARGEDIDAKRLERRTERAKKRIKYDFKELIIERLIERGYVDDEKFARYYVENRFVKKGVSQKRLKMELMKKGVDTEIIEEVLDGRDDEEEILKIIAKKRAKYDDEKLVSYLCRQGFPYQLAQSLVAAHGKD
ncbi:regulatory protein RecX [Candidatus Nanosyncoccus alces]|uniref:Regulatory protein RecX n=1 Tax=Candidatus Nanosyncoccus alces TaxID=2171997 RepID=A0ABY0FNR0_9BACT|nr:RecX family transcriptional regulator [Candidatus Nanosyncoccus alces]RYC74848.1 Regulatory protein RecX [Candidatus Nanosyncoccus alces]